MHPELTKRRELVEREIREVSGAVRLLRRRRIAGPGTWRRRSWHITRSVRASSSHCWSVRAVLN